MSTATPSVPFAAAGLGPLRAKAGWIVALGVVYVIAGIIALGSVVFATPWGWVVFSGVVTLLLGLIILAHWPVSGLWVLGVLLGVDLIIAGFSWIGIGFGLRRLAT